MRNVSLKNEKLDQHATNMFEKKKNLWNVKLYEAAMLKMKVFKDCLSYLECVVNYGSLER